MIYPSNGYRNVDILIGEKMPFIGQFVYPVGGDELKGGWGKRYFNDNLV